MGQILAFTHLTMDGVMQAPGREDEDRRDGFACGGWAAATRNDPVMAKVIGAGMSKTSGLLFGRWTYESFHAFWPHQPEPNPFTAMLNASRKYVASRTLTAPLPWQNSTLLDGDAADAVADLKKDPATNLVILGSGELVRSLLGRGMIDELVLLTHPVVLGTGRRLFGDDGLSARFHLTDTTPTTTGVIIASYRRRAQEGM